jgi:hypothetical protein
VNDLYLLLKASLKVLLPFDRLMALSKAEGPFDMPFDKLTVLSKVEGLTVLSKVEGLTALSKAEGRCCIWRFFLCRLIYGRQVPRKPRLVGGVEGHNEK